MTSRSLLSEGIKGETIHYLWVSDAFDIRRIKDRLTAVEEGPKQCAIPSVVSRLVAA